MCSFFAAAVWLLLDSLAVWELNQLKQHKGPTNLSLYKVQLLCSVWTDIPSGKCRDMTVHRVCNRKFKVYYFIL